MANFTKQAIRNTFIKLLNEKPLNRIMVKDIVDECGINRNTFYYYYRDLPELLQTIIEEEAQRIIREYPSIDSIEECLNAIIGFALENRRAVMHIYHSTTRDIYEQYQWKSCEYVVTIFVDGILSGRTIEEQDRKLIIDYLKCVCFGLIIGWLEEGMKSDVQARFHRICELRQGDLERMIERCEKTKGGKYGKREVSVSEHINRAAQN